MSNEYQELLEAEGFSWDKHNIEKNIEKHRVYPHEAEQIFFNSPLLIHDDALHSTENEHRYLALGKTDEGRRLFCAFTMKDKRIRIISIRDMTPNERGAYHEHE